MSSGILGLEELERLAADSDFEPGLMAMNYPISLRQLERIVRRDYGMTVRQFTRKVQCRSAVRLISEGRYNSAVAVDLKFGNEQHFCHVIKKEYGASPQSFRPLYGRKVEIPPGPLQQKAAPKAQKAP